MWYVTIFLGPMKIILNKIPSFRFLTELMLLYYRDRFKLTHNKLEESSHFQLPTNRPPYRNEKRRSSNCSFKSSCSIPSFSTPSQALLLIGMKPSNKPQQDLNKNNAGRPPIRKPNMQKPPIMSKSRSLASSMNKDPHVLQLPELGVNGSGDLVIRKKQIISG